MNRLFLILLLISYSGITAQESDTLYTDSYINQKIDSAWIMLDYGLNIDDGLRIGLELMNIEEDHNQFLARVNALQLIGEYHFWTTQMDSALYYYQLANDMAVAEGDSSEMSYTWLALGSLNSEMNNYDKASSYFQNALDIRIAMADTNDIVFYSDPQRVDELFGRQAFACLKGFFTMSSICGSIERFIKHERRIQRDGRGA